MVGQTVVAQVTFLDNVDALLVVCYHIAIVSRMIFLTEHTLLLSLLPEYDFQRSHRKYVS